MENKDKKQIPLRLAAKLWQEISAWAQDDFRSVNGQIEYLLNECVKARKKGIFPPRIENADSDVENAKKHDNTD